MSELQGVADFILKYGWLAVTLISWALFLTGVIHSDKEFQREVERGDKSLEQRDEAIKLAQTVISVVESGRRGEYRAGR